MLIVSSTPGSANLSRKHQNGQKLRLLAGILVLLLVTIALTIVWTRANQPYRYWPGWYVARFPDKIDGALLHETLESEGISGSLSAWSARVLFQAIPRTVEIPVVDIDRRMEPGDPRLDPFLRNIGRLFRSGDHGVIYLPTDRSIVAYRRILRGHPLLAGMEIMDDNFRSVVQSALIFFIAAGLIWLLTARGAANLALIVLPWLTIVALAGGGALPAVLASYGVVVFRHSRSRYALGCWVAAAVLIVFAVLYLTPVLTAMLIFAFVASEAVPRLLKFQKLLRGERPSKSTRSLFRRWEHLLFEPLALAPSNRKKVKSSVDPLPIGKTVAVVGIVVLSLFYPEPADHDPIPASGRVIAPFDSTSGLHRLSQMQTADRLPDLADLVSSTAYQEGFMSGAAYSLPFSGDSLTRRQYRDSESVIVVEEQALTTYDEAWFTETIDRVLRRGVGKLYASLGGIAPINTVTRLESRVFRKNIDFAAYALIVLVMILMVVSGFSLPRRAVVSGRRHSSPLMLRRRTQAA